MLGLSSEALASIGTTVTVPMLVTVRVISTVVTETGTAEGVLLTGSSLEELAASKDEIKAEGNELLSSELDDSSGSVDVLVAVGISVATRVCVDSPSGTTVASEEVNKASELYDSSMSLDVMTTETFADGEVARLEDSEVVFMSEGALVVVVLAYVHALIVLEGGFVPSKLVIEFCAVGNEVTSLSPVSLGIDKDAVGCPSALSLLITVEFGVTETLNNVESPVEL